MSEELARTLLYGLSDCPVRLVGATTRGHAVYLLAHSEARLLVRRAAMRPTAKGYAEARFLDAIEGLEASLKDEEARRVAVGTAKRALRSMPASLARTRRIIEHLEELGPPDHLASARRADEANRAYFERVARLLLAAGDELEG